MRRAAAAFAVSMVCVSPALAQQTRDLGLPPPFDTPILQQPVNPVLPPPSGQRYVPGAGGAYGDRDRPPALAIAPQRLRGVEPTSLRGEVQASQRGARGDRIENLAQMKSQLRACWTPPAGFEPKRKLDATIRFTLARDGAVEGSPAITYVNQSASPMQRAAIVDSLRAALKTCAPFPAGPAVTGRPLFIRFIVDGNGPAA